MFQGIWTRLRLRDELRTPLQYYETRDVCGRKKGQQPTARDLHAGPLVSYSSGELNKALRQY